MSDEFYDGLHICWVCGNAYTQTEVCTRCAQQHAIDMEGINEDPLFPHCYICGHAYESGTGTWSDYGHWFCERHETIIPF